MIIDIMVETEGRDRYHVRRRGAEVAEMSDQVVVQMALLLMRDAYMEMKAALERRMPPRVSSIPAAKDLREE